MTLLDTIACPTGISRLTTVGNRIFVAGRAAFMRAYDWDGASLSLAAVGGSGQGSGWGVTATPDGSVHTVTDLGGVGVRKGIIEVEVSGSAIVDDSSLIFDDAGEDVFAYNATQLFTAGDAGLRRISWNGTGYTLDYTQDPGLGTGGYSVRKLTGSDLIALGGDYPTARFGLVSDTGSGFTLLDSDTAWAGSADVGGVYSAFTAPTILWAGNSTRIKAYDISSRLLTQIDSLDSVPGKIGGTYGGRIVAAGGSSVAIYRLQGGSIVQEDVLTDGITFSNLMAPVIIDGVVFVVDGTTDVLSAIGVDWGFEDPIGPTDPYLRMYQHLLPRAKAWRI